MYRALMTLSLAGLLAGATGATFAQEPAQPDNTKINKRDRQADEPTADQQKENGSDRDLAKNVRRAIVKDKSLSTYAHNVKVIAQNGTVTLKGPVRSTEESKAIEAKAVEVAGPGNVKNELAVKDNTDSNKH
jgi:hyperosmotically inducible protein